MVFARAHSNFVWRVLSGELNRDSPDLPLPAPAVYLWPLFPNKALALSRSLSLSLALFGPQRLAPVRFGSFRIALLTVYYVHCLAMLAHACTLLH
jgi:hypothetical protein